MWAKQLPVTWLAAHSYFKVTYKRFILLVLFTIVSLKLTGLFYVLKYLLKEYIDRQTDRIPVKTRWDKASQGKN